MKENRNIDRLFQESFKDFEVEAPKNAWENIEKRLNKSSRKPIVPLWQKLSGVAAAIAIILVAGSVLLNNTQWLKPNNTIVDAPVNNTENNNLQNSNLVFPVTEGNENNFGEPQIVERFDESNTNSSNTDPLAVEAIVLNSTEKSNESASNISNKDVAVIQKNSSFNNPTSEFSYKESLVSEPIIKNVKTITAPDYIQKDNISIFNETTQQSLVEVAQQIYLQETESAGKTERNEWFVKPQIAPTFYGNLGSGSAIDDNLANNSSSGDVNMSFGVNVAYQLNDRIKIRSGVNRVNLNYSTNDVYVVPGAGFSSFNNASVNGNYEASVLTEQQLINLNEQGLVGRFPSETSQLQQQLGYIEIPMELEFKLLDKAININLIGGASTLLLNENNIDVRTAGVSNSIGEANNLNEVSFSTNFALGFDYDISQKLMLNLEPTFKYQINTFQSGTTKFQPYFFGIYSGVIFKF